MPAEHTADHLAFYPRGRCANPDNVDDWLTINPDSFDVHEMHCQVLVARANKRGDYLAKFRCDDSLIQNYWFSLFNDRLYVDRNVPANDVQLLGSTTKVLVRSDLHPEIVQLLLQTMVEVH